MSFLGVSLGIGAVTAGSKIITGLHQNKLANQIKPEWEQYQTSPFAKDQLGLAKQLYGGRMAGAAQEEQNIASSQSGFLNNVSRNATDSSQALALGGLAQGTSNNAYNNLQLKEAQNKNSFLDNLNAAYRGMIGEGDKEYQSMMDKYQSDVGAKTALRNSGAQNLNSGISDLGSSAFMANQYGFGGGGTQYKIPNQKITGQ